MEDEPMIPDAVDPEAEPGAPAWFEAIFPGGPQTGFFLKGAVNSISYVEHGRDVLFFSFDNLSNVGNARLDRIPWGYELAAKRGWSHLGVMPRASTWYRDPELIAELEHLRDRGFFHKFKKVVMTGTSMGGFGALTFSSLVPNATVLAYSPQSTLAKDLVPWETRFFKGRRADWTLPYRDATEQISGADKVYLFYDPFYAPDRTHIERFSGDNLELIPCWGAGHKSALFLRRMHTLSDVATRVAEDQFTRDWFFEMYRDRFNVQLYRLNMQQHFLDRGQEDRANALVRAFRSRKRRLNAALPQ